MPQPAWIDEIARRYLADEASVFLVHGDVRDAVWEVDGSDRPVDAAKALVLFLRRSREVVAVLRPGPPPARLEFAEFTDRQKFENLVRAADVLHGKALAANEADPLQCLARIWRALTTSGTAQGYVVSDTERLMPAAKKWLDKVPDAPDLFTWPTHPTVRQSNNLIVFLAPSLESVRAELVRDACCISTRSAEPARTVADVADELPDAEVPSSSTGDLAAQPLPPPTEGTAVREQLERELVHALCTHPEEVRPALVPVMQAVARVLETRAPERFGAVSFGVDEDGRATLEGPGADAFADAWKADIALSASAGMVLKGLSGGFSEARPPALDTTGVGALTRRVERLLR